MNGGIWSCKRFVRDPSQKIEVTFNQSRVLWSFLYFRITSTSMPVSWPTLHSVDISSPSPSWKSLASAPDPPRRGAVLAPDSPRYLLRSGGFSGYEIGGNLDVYDTHLDEWSSYDLSKNGELPRARSRHALIPVNSTEEGLESVFALMLFGELNPAPVELGHAGAGKFSFSLV